ncbi:uncharacterized protein LOC125226279 isoform X1 [Leguminivora glycinivorella]|uniref:uncharacterized protein LOC125226279 isoform X1 n=1 Tax=Leguminivora glycinivorella TaxID=1035111 RepID=UPI0020105E99|nr:uncharacterized protein LOC125226279 isoform X1 [Leguminivora glycinivorella]
MGLVLSAIISYAGVLEALECLRHILAGVVPDTEPDFQDLLEYYSGLLHKAAQTANSSDWTTRCGQGYLCLTQDDNGKLARAAVKYYDGQPDSTAILFSTKISSFGQESVESNNSHANGDYRTERYTPTRTKTIITNASESFSVGNRNRSPASCENISDPNHFLGNSSGRDERSTERSEAKEKLTWHYRPKSPTPQNLPDIQFHSSVDEEIRSNEAYSEDFLRSLDGIKLRPLQRSDPSGRRRSFKKRHSSSSTSSRESRASREEELKMFTSLEEAEFERMTLEREQGSPNLGSHSRSRSRESESSKDRATQVSTVDSALTEEEPLLKPKLRDLPKLGSFEEKEEKETEVNAEEAEIDDFWGSGD